MKPFHDVIRSLVGFFIWAERFGNYWNVAMRNQNASYPPNRIPGIITTLFTNPVTNRANVRAQHFFRCWSSVGQQISKPGPQLLSVGPGCDKKGIIMHELMHALGFWHEQSRTDRNKYVEVLWENVGKGEWAENTALLYPVVMFVCMSV